MRMKRKFLYILVPSLLATFALASCGADTGDQEDLPNRTALGPLTEAATTTILPDPTQTPELPLPGSVAATTPLPEYVRLDLEDGIVVAFADDPSLGRIAYVTHVPSGAQAVLDAKGNMIGREDSRARIARRLILRWRAAMSLRESRQAFDTMALFQEIQLGTGSTLSGSMVSYTPRNRITISTNRIWDSCFIG